MNNIVANIMINAIVTIAITKDVNVKPWIKIMIKEQENVGNVSYL